MIAHVWTDDELLHILAMRDGGWSARESAAWLKKLRGLPPLTATNRLVPPRKADDPKRHADWSAIHRASPGPDRW